MLSPAGASNFKTSFPSMLYTLTTAFAWLSTCNAPLKEITLNSTLERGRINFIGLIAPSLLEEGSASDELLVPLGEDTATDELLARLEEDTATDELLARLEEDTAADELLAMLEEDTAAEELLAMLEEDTAAEELLALLEEDTAAELEEAAGGELPPIVKIFFVTLPEPLP